MQYFYEETVLLNIIQIIYNFYFHILYTFIFCFVNYQNYIPSYLFVYYVLKQLAS